MKCCIEDYDYLSNIETIATLQYENSNFYLLIKKIKTITNNKKRNLISIDLGIRTYITGYSNNNIIKIGSFSNKIKSIDRIMKNHKLHQRNKIKNKKYQKIKNMITDFKWKTTKYLTDNYKTILIGNFSTKSMGEQDTICKMTKRIGNMYNIYDFKQKLKYKCYITNTNYK
jgi:putative transposase